MAAQEMLPEAPITVIDSLSTAMGMYLMLDAAAQATADGATRQETAALLEDLKDRVSVSFVVDTLEYLAKGGRIGNAKAFLGTLLKVKPILVLQDGLIEPLEQVRSKHKAIARMIELTEERVNGRGKQAKISIAHAMSPDEANVLKEEIMGRLGCAEPPISEVGPVIGTHTGPGVIGLGVYV